MVVASLPCLRDIFLHTAWLLALLSPSSRGVNAYFVEDQLVGPVKIGETYAISISSDLAITDIQPTIAQDSLKHVYHLQHPGASYISVHFQQLTIPEGCSIEIASTSNNDRQQRPSTFVNGDFERLRRWSGQVFSDQASIIVQCHDHDAISFLIDEYAAGYADLAEKEASMMAAAEQDNSIISNTGNHNRNNTDHSRRGLSLRGSQHQQRDLKICTDNDLLDAKCYQNSDPAMYDKIRAVGRVYISGLYACTGYLVGPSNHFMTNYHCIKNQQDVANTNFEFMAEDDYCGGTAGDRWFSKAGTVVEDSVANPHRMIVDSKSDDWTLIKLAGNPNAQYGYLDLAPAPIAEERIVIPQHPLGRTKEVGYHDSHIGNNAYCHLMTNAYQGMEYSCDTQGGSSGAPILSHATMKVIGLHKGAYPTCSNVGTASNKFYDIVYPIAYSTDNPTKNPTPSPTNSPSMQTTTVPTGEPTASPTSASPAMLTPSKHFASCGRAGQCSRQSEGRFDDGVRHEVRCCSDKSMSGWGKRSNCDVWAESIFGSTCHTSKTFDEAEALCEEEGGRLCTNTELKNDCTRGSGCGHDNQVVWSSTAGAVVSKELPTTGGNAPRYAACGKSGRCGNEPNGLFDINTAHEVRCCSDFAISGWKKRSQCSVWAESDVGGKCHHDKTFWEANDLCLAAGARLCTYAELDNDCTHGTGCRHDMELVWSSTTAL